MSTNLSTACHKTNDVWVYFIALLEDLQAKEPQTA